MPGRVLSAPGAELVPATSVRAIAAAASTTSTSTNTITITITTTTTAFGLPILIDLHVGMTQAVPH